MRDEAPVYYSEPRLVRLTRFEDVRAAALDADTFRSFEGMDIDDSRLEQAPPGSSAAWTTPGTTWSARWCSRTSCRAASLSSRTGSAGWCATSSPVADRGAGGRSIGIAPRAGLAHALRRVLPPDGHAEPARQGPRGAGAARATGALDPRAEGPGTRHTPPDPGGEGSHRRRPAVLHRSARGPPPLCPRGPGHDVRAGRHRRGAVRGRARSRRPRRSAA